MKASNLESTKKSYYVEVDRDGDARFVGPMSEIEAKVIEQSMLGQVSVIDEDQYKRLFEVFSSNDPMLTSLEDYTED